MATAEDGDRSVVTGGADKQGMQTSLQSRYHVDKVEMFLCVGTLCPPMSLVPLRQLGDTAIRLDVCMQPLYIDVAFFAAAKQVFTRLYPGVNPSCSLLASRPVPYHMLPSLPPCHTDLQLAGGAEGAL